MNIILKNGSGEIEEKKSRFICHIFKIKSEEEAEEYITAVKKKYWDARHNCYAYVIGERNDNPLVFKTFDKAVAANPNAHPLFHSDRGFQYTNRTFHTKLEKAGMTQSMSRVAHCIDNGPMEGFWGILKTEIYYLYHFEDYETLRKTICAYIDFYNNDRYQKKLGCMTPAEFIAASAK